jgi:hypothetical protein
MKKRDKIIYWIVTGLLSYIMLISAITYFINNETVSETFEKLGYPTYIIYPLAIAKILGIIAIVTNKSWVLREWAYAGFFYDIVLAASAHIVTGYGGFIPASGAMTLLIISYLFGLKIYRSEKKQNEKNCC